MSYNNYGDSQPGYGGYNPYGQQQPQADPYAQAETGQAYPMQTMPQAASQSDLLNMCRDVNAGIDELRVKREGQLTIAQNALLESNTGREDQTTRQSLEYVENDLNQAFQVLKERIAKIKTMQNSGQTDVQRQLELSSRKIQAEFQEYQRSQRNFQKRLEEQVRRRYQIANPEASPEELEQGVQNVLQGQEQAFQYTGARTKRANDVRQATQERSAAIRKINQDMVQLAQLVQEVAELVQQQEPMITQINQDADQAATNIQDANTQLTGAIKSARNARKWKWYALIIIIIIIAIIVGVAVGVTQANK